jgi:hypothetical protein
MKYVSYLYEWPQELVYFGSSVCQRQSTYGVSKCQTQFQVGRSSPSAGGPARHVLTEFGHVTYIKRGKAKEWKKG